MSHTLIIGFGNPLRQDDGIGFRAAEELERILDPERTTCLALHQLTPDLAELLSRAERVIFIDARQGGVPGEIEVASLVPDERTMLGSTHELSPVALMTLTQAVYSQAPAATLITVGTRSLDHGCKLSPEVEAALAGVITFIRETVESG